MGEMLGAVPGRILGRRYMEEFPGLAAQGYKDLLDGVWHSGREYVAHEQPAQLPHHRHGETGYYNFTYVPLREAEGSIAGIMCVAVDVTAQVLTRRQVQHLNQELASINGELAAANEELRASNEELAESNGQLLRTNADLDNFIYTASHDLKAPISNIEGLLGALLRTLPAESLALERVQGITGMMQDSVERFRKTIASLTEVVKLQKENSQQATEVNLPEVIREVLLDLEPVMGSTGARVDTDMEKCRTIRFPEKNLRSVIYNLISNGIKYRSPERLPRVRIECRSTADCHVLTVSDNGLGLRDSQLDKLFTMFKRFHDHVEGSGIGLYMIRKMVENAGGRIEVESRVGEGTVFTVFFPR
jgi:signal transduction histidine kinase